VALAGGVLATAALLSRTPEAPVVSGTAEVPVAGRPAMPASVGFWDFVQPPAPPSPEMPNDTGFGDRIR
jgi:hypothetical protein